MSMLDTMTPLISPGICRCRFAYRGVALGTSEDDLADPSGRPTGSIVSRLRAVQHLANASLANERFPSSGPRESAMMASGTPQRRPIARSELRLCA